MKPTNQRKGSPSEGEFLKRQEWSRFRGLKSTRNRQLHPSMFLLQQHSRAANGASVSQSSCRPGRRVRHHTDLTERAGSRGPQLGGRQWGSAAPLHRNRKWWRRSEGQDQWTVGLGQLEKDNWKNIIKCRSCITQERHLIIFSNLLIFIYLNYLFKNSTLTYLWMYSIMTSLLVTMFSIF